MNQFADFNQIFMHITLGHDDELCFHGHSRTLLAKFMPKVAGMHNILCICWQILTRFACIYCNIMT